MPNQDLDTAMGADLLLRRRMASSAVPSPPVYQANPQDPQQQTRANLAALLKGKPNGR